MDKYKGKGEDGLLVFFFFPGGGKEGSLDVSKRNAS